MGHPGSFVLLYFSTRLQGIACLFTDQYNTKGYDTFTDVL